MANNNVTSNQALSSMSIKELHKFSLSSRQHAKDVHSLEENSFLVPFIWISITSEKNEIYVYKNQNQDTNEWLFMWTIKNIAGYKPKTSPCSLIKNDIITPKKLDEVYNLALAPRRNKDCTTNSIITHLLYIFPKCIVGGLEISLRGIGDGSFRPQNAIEAITRAENVRIENSDSQSVSLSILKNIEITKSYRNKSDVCLYRRTSDKLMCTDMVNCANASWMSEETLLNLNCTTIILGKTAFRKEILMEFMLQLKNKDERNADRIRDVDIEHPRDVGTLDWNVLEAEPWNSPTMDQSYEKMTPGDWHDFGPSTMVIKRDSTTVFAVDQFCETNLIISVFELIAGGTPI